MLWFVDRSGQDRFNLNKSNFEINNFNTQVTNKDYLVMIFGFILYSIYFFYSTFKLFPKNVPPEALQDAKGIVFASESDADVEKWCDVLNKAALGFIIQTSTPDEPGLSSILCISMPICSSRNWCISRGTCPLVLHLSAN